MRGRGWATTSEVTKIRSPRRRSTMPAPKARTRRLGAAHVDPQHLLEVLGRGLERASPAGSSPRWTRGSPPARTPPRPPWRTRRPSPGRPGRGGKAAASPPSARIGVGRPPRRPRRAARPEHDGMAGPGQRARRLGADARRGAGDHGRPALGVGFEARHQRGVTVVGQRGEAAHVDGVDPLHARRVDVVVLAPGPAPRPSATRASMRASAAPMQKWRPPPKLIRFCVSRSRS